MFPSRQMLRLNLEMDQDDWETIQYDETFDIEVDVNDLLMIIAAWDIELRRERPAGHLLGT